MRQAAATALVLALCTLGGASPAGATTPRPSGLVRGRVLVCNAPGHCLTRVFRVAAVAGSGVVVARTKTSGVANAYSFHLAVGRYSLVAVSNGLHCKGSVVVRARRTVTANITCLVS